ncbi:hypothetical protein [Neorhizobium sp. NCHU2750]|uniref:hypothetical protein n=1 Tax=Neorhizobium sp. NCHU2750 TaxID=1825976 RepID=UPI000EB650C4|nr:hypothetical protein NCHU2750_06960 [Neorhizobium sp. NCHU2750]
MEWVPIVFITFKVLALGTAMFFAIKWHYDQGEQKRREMLRTGGKLAAVFVVALAGLGAVTFALTSMLGLDLSL